MITSADRFSTSHSPYPAAATMLRFAGFVGAKCRSGPR